MTNLLAFDTSSAYCSVALSVNGRVISRVAEENRKAAQQVLPMAEELLSGAGLDLQGVDILSIVAGPGSFTGLRIGIGIVQGLSLANDTAVVTQSSLALLAFAACRRFGGVHWISCLPTGGKECYVGLYETQPSASPVTYKEIVTSPDAELDAIVPAGQFSWAGVGAGWSDMGSASSGIALSSCRADFTYSPEDQCALALIDYQLGKTSKGELVLPNYVKDDMDYS